MFEGLDLGPKQRATVAAATALGAALVLAVFGAVQAIEGYILTPRIVGSRTGLHPPLIIFAVFFWGVALDGIIGMMVAIPLTAFAVVFRRLLKKKYITEVVYMWSKSGAAPSSHLWDRQKGDIA